MVEGAGRSHRPAPSEENFPGAPILSSPEPAGTDGGANGGIAESRRNPREASREGLGAVPTPPALARRLVEPLLAGAADGPLPRVLDPACGEGELLEQALLALAARAGGDRARAARGLFGIELDPERARRCRARLRLVAGPGADAGLEGRIVQGDALDPALAWPAGTLVVANPPWVSLSGRQAAHLPAERLALYRASWRAWAAWPSLHGAFLERVAAHVAAERTGARVLVPAAVCEQERYGATRGAVTGAARLALAPLAVDEAAFPDLTAPAVILTLAAGGRRGPGTAAPWVARGVEDAAFLAALERFPRLPPRSFADPGVHTGNCARELVRRGADGRAARGVGGRWVPLREGRDLRPFGLAPLGAVATRLRVDLERTGGRRFRIAPLERYAAFPVLLRQTADRPLAALHEEPAAFRNSLLACRAVDGLDPAFVVGVLNGAAAGRWHRLAFRDARQRAFPQVKVGHLATQPFPIAHRDADPALHDAVVALARRMTKLPTDDPACEAIGRELEAVLAEALG